MKTRTMRKTKIDYPQWTRNADRQLNKTMARLIGGLGCGVIAMGACAAFPQYGAVALGLIVGWKTTKLLNTYPEKKPYGQPRQQRAST